MPEKLKKKKHYGSKRIFFFYTFTQSDTQDVFAVM